jgi:hypothetical protein
MELYEPRVRARPTAQALLAGIESMGLLSILKKVRQMEREMRILMVYVPRHPPPHTRAPKPLCAMVCLHSILARPVSSASIHAREEVRRACSRGRADATKVTGAVCGTQGPGQRGQDDNRQKVQWRRH